jgi:phage gp36-like protein
VAAVYFISREQLEARLGVRVVKDIYDDNLDGTADDNAIDRLRADASSKVAARLGSYPNAFTTIPEEVVRVTLDAAVAMAAQRHPEYVRRNWEPLMTQVDKDLDAIQKAKARLDAQGSPSTATNVGGLVVVDGVRTRTGVLVPRPGKFSGGFGDF